MRIFLLLLIIFINVSVLCFAKEFFPDEEISDEVVSYLDKVVRASLSPPLTENEKTKKILSPEEIRLAIEHGRLVKMMFICGMDGEKEFNSFLIEGLKKGWKVRQAAYASYLQHASMQYYGDILTNQGCTPAVKQYFSENRIAQGAQKFQFLYRVRL